MLSIGHGPLAIVMAGSHQCHVFTTTYPSGGYGGLQEKPYPAISLPLSRPPKARRAPQSSLWSAAVAASEGQCLGSSPRSAKFSMPSQDELGQGPAWSALVMDP